MTLTAANHSSPTDKYGRIVQEVCVSTGYILANGQAVEGSSVLNHFVLTGDGTNEATATAYDGTDNTGTVLMFAHVDSNGRISGGVNLNVDAPDGIYVEITGTGGKLLVHALFI